jgi:septal ring factor EnvC (AmiA/AmiB activator)
VSGVVRRGFGSPAATTSAPSQGIDIAAAEGSPVGAVHDGIVAFADSFVGLGRLVIIDHGGQAFTLYGNLRELAIARGTQVEHGQTLGTVGVAPNGAAGLYFELRVDGRPVDPLQWLRKR